MSRASRMMFWTSILVLQIALLLLFMAGCTPVPA